MREKEKEKKLILKESNTLLKPPEMKGCKWEMENGICLHFIRYFGVKIQSERIPPVYFAKSFYTRSK